MVRTSILALCVLVLSASAAVHAAPALAAKPNILIILSDDLGYADVGFHGSKEVKTPHLDALAKSGVRCTSGYVTHPFCSPTRAALLTGRYQQRFGHEYNPVYDPLDLTEGLPLNERLLPQFMKEAGYLTGWIGKWHLGSSPAHTPWRRGFDETFGFIGGGHQFINWTPNERQYTLPITRDGRPVEVNDHLTTAFGYEASAFVRRHSDGASWLLYLAFNAPHGPQQPTAEREKRFASIEAAQRRKYVAQISLLDDAVGTVIRALAESGQAERTLVFFLSDNGGPLLLLTAKNEPLRGSKGSVYEGGVRVPFVVSWPGQFLAGTTYDAPVSSLDIFATALALAETSMAPGKSYDGVNLVPYLTGKSKTPPHDRLFWRTEGGRARAVREGRWKFVQFKDKPAELYDLATDIGESRDLAAREPQIARRLSLALGAWDKELIPPLFLGSSVKNEDWGPGGANQKGNRDAVKRAPAR
jgi:arylsulfatase A-like enzyme